MSKQSKISVEKVPSSPYLPLTFPLVQTSDDSKLPKPQSAATDDNDQAKTPLSSNSEEDETSANRSKNSKENNPLIWKFTKISAVKEQ